MADGVTAYPRLLSRYVELAFKKEIGENLGEYLEDRSLLQDAMKFGFSILGDKTVEGVRIQKVSRSAEKNKTV